MKYNFYCGNELMEMEVYETTRKDLLGYLDQYLENLKNEWFDSSNDVFLILYKNGIIDRIDLDYDGHKIRKQNIAKIKQEEHFMNNTSYFKNITSLEDLRKQYKALLKTYHPDNGGDTETIKIINVEYEYLFAVLKDSRTEDKEKSTSFNKESDTALRNVLNAIINLNVNIEICGTWIWVTGNTYPVKEQLKVNGFKFSKNKKAWYWHGEEYVRFSKKRFSLENIRSMYGSEEVKTSKQAYIGA